MKQGYFEASINIYTLCIKQAKWFKIAHQKYNQENFVLEIILLNTFFSSLVFFINRR